MTVFHLDIPVDDALPLAGQDSLDDLPEELPGQLFLQDALLSDEVKQVLDEDTSLEDKPELVFTLHGSGRSMTMMKESWRSK